MSGHADVAIERVWLDVTSLLSCTTQPHGIPRTLFNIFSEWRTLPFRKLQFCRLHGEPDQSPNGYLEVDPEIVAAQLQTAWRDTSDDPEPPRPFKKRVVDFFWPVLRWVPRPIRRGLKKVAAWAKAGLRQGIAKLKKAAAELQRWTRGDFSGPPPAPLIRFDKSDLLVLAGLTWDRPETIALHWELKQQTGLRQAYLIYDLIPVFYPQYFGKGLGEIYTRWLTDAMWSADFVWAISENTRRDLREHLDRCLLRNPAAIEVIRLGENLPKAGLARPPKGLALKPEEPFVLCVGTLEFRKNHLLLYQVWHALANKIGPDALPKLVVVGRPGYLFENFCALAQHDPLTEDKILFRSQATDAELRWLYQNCQFTMYPSQYEGWGLPVAESLAFGKYCISSGSSSLPEIGGPLAGYHDPLDVDRCAELVCEALDLAFLSLREREIRAGYRRTTWAETAAQMLRQLEAKYGRILDQEHPHATIESAAA